MVTGDVTGHAGGASTLPKGTVTFLLTDVEGSSRAWENAPESTGVAISRHYEVLDAVIAANNGVRPVEQGEGDSVVGAFSRASDALAAAVVAQRSLAVNVPGLRVRMALHTGEAQLRDEGNYFGQAIIRCARIRALGHGGQVLLSDSCAALVVDRLPHGVRLVDLGLHRLKDLARPARIWQVADAESAGEFPPLRSLDAVRHNLPVQLTPLIGREGEIRELHDLLGQERMVTLTGAGGVGKTRLALAVAAEATDTRTGGVWWVDLAPLDGQGVVARAALAAVGADQLASSSLAHQLAVELGDEPCLLVLDNCEHVVAECAAVSAEVLAANGAVAVLTTSREPVGVPGEVAWRVPSLEAPSPEGVLDLSVMSQADAVRLFADRARRANPSFTVNQVNAAAVAQVCYRLDGIPLAIELAAARCRHLSAERIAAELDDRFRLLTGGARTVLPRQQSLTASIAWTHDRLDLAERLTFRRLGVFAGPFTLEAAETVVASTGDLDPVEVLDLIGRLVDRNLVVVAEAVDGAARYRLLETLRAYACGRAEEAGELDRLREAHARGWLRWLATRFQVLHTDAVTEEVDERHADLLSAVNWAANAQPKLGIRLLALAATPWQGCGRPSDALAAFDRVMTDENADLHPELWAAAAVSMSLLVDMARGSDEFLRVLDRADHVARASGATYVSAVAAWLRTMDADSSAEVRDLARHQGDIYTEAVCVINMAQAAVTADPTRAGPQLAEAAALADRSASTYLKNFETQVRAQSALHCGHLAIAVELAAGMVDSRSAIMADSAIFLLLTAGLLTADAAALRVALQAARRFDRKLPKFVDYVDDATHCLALLAGRPSRVRLNRAAWAWPAPVAQWLVCREAIDADARVVAVEAARVAAQPTSLGTTMRAAVDAVATGDEDCWRDVLGLAVDHDLPLFGIDALEHLGVLAANGGSWAEALRLLAAGQRLRDETGYQWRFASEQHRVDSALQGARKALGDDSATYSSQGATLPWREAAARARQVHGNAGDQPSDEGASGG
jgi:predicted ATPase/class 3 adenylate cyclase